MKKLCTCCKKHCICCPQHSENDAEAKSTDLVQILFEVKELQLRILERLPEQQEPLPQPRLDDFIDALELARKLHVTDRTVRRYKKAGILVPYTLGERDYYVWAEVVLAMRKNGVSRK